jgi:antitoxin component of RelBE/YafQ-DinJ toxin-antitoxin module
MKKDIKATSIRMTAEAKRLQAALSEKMGISMTAVIELAIRQMAKKEGLK